MAPLVAFRSCLIMYNNCSLYVAENKLLVVVVSRNTHCNVNIGIANIIDDTDIIDPSILLTHLYWYGRLYILC